MRIVGDTDRERLNGGRELVERFLELGRCLELERIPEIDRGRALGGLVLLLGLGCLRVGQRK